MCGVCYFAAFPQFMEHYCLKTSLLVDYPLAFIILVPLLQKVNYQIRMINRM